MESILPGAIVPGNQIIKPGQYVTEIPVFEKPERKVVKYRVPGIFPEFPLKTSTRTPTYVPGNKVIVS